MKTFADQIKSHTQLRHSFCSRMLMTTTFALVFVMIGLPQAASAAPIPITTCPATIGSPGQYRLDVDCKVDTGNGINISASNVSLNLNGHTLSGPISTANDCSSLPASDTTGISISGSNVHVRNGEVVRFAGGIVSQSPGHDNQANNLLVTGNCKGITVHFSDNNQINGNNVSGNHNFGVGFVSADNNRASNNIANNNGPIAGGAGIFIIDSNGNTINGNETHVNQNISGIRLINSHNNTIRNNRTNGNSNYGILIDNDGSSGNLLQANTAVLTVTGGADLADFNSYSPTPPPPPCINTWRNNTFYTDTDPGADAGPGVGCIQ